MKATTHCDDAAPCSSSHPLMCFMFLLRVVAPVRTSPFIKYAIVATPTACAQCVQNVWLQLKPDLLHYRINIASVPSVIIKLLIAITPLSCAKDDQRASLEIFHRERLSSAMDIGNVSHGSTGVKNATMLWEWHIQAEQGHPLCSV